MYLDMCSYEFVIMIKYDAIHEVKRNECLMSSYKILLIYIKFSFTNPTTKIVGKYGYL